jgi:hypothetical protein
VIQRSDRDADVRHDAPTTEVGSEGGSPGDVEIARTRLPATGAEADETVAPQRDDAAPIARDQSGEGRRSP